MTVTATLERAGALARDGDVAGAASVVSDVVDGPDPLSTADRVLLLTALVGYLVIGSRHEESMRRAHDLARRIGIADVPPLWADALALLVGAVQRITPGGLFARALGWAMRAGRLRPWATMDAVRAVQLAVFWHDIRACRRLAMLQLALSRTDQHVQRSIAWLGYSYAYCGNPQGLVFLRRALVLAHRAHDEATLVETYPLLAIGYQMCGDSERARRYHALFQHRYGHRSPFYKLLSLANGLAVLCSRGDFAALTPQIDACFAQSFALDASRYHLQIYGAHAFLMAVEGRSDEAATALALAFNAAEKNGNALDWTIYYRLAALAHVLGGSFDEARRCAEQGLATSARYGRTRWYERELRALLAIAREPEAITPYRAQLMSASARYLASQVSRNRANTPDGRISALSEQLAEALSSQLEFDPSRPPSVEDLRTKLTRTFKTDYVVFGRNFAELKEAVRRDRGLDRSSLMTELGGELRLVCKSGQFFLGIQCAHTSEFKENLAVGLLLGNLDPLSESLVKAAFRLVLSQYVFVHSIRISRDIQARQQRAAAVGMMAQMLAHDVRRPFQMIRAAIGVLKKAETPEQFRREIELVLPEIEMATESADGLIADVMEVSAPSRATRLEPTAPETLIGGALLETFRSYPRADVRFEYEFRHRGSVSAEPKKVQRVFSNIIANAVQAMDHRGCISFSTRQVIHDERPFVEFVIANDGPAIPDEDLAGLFDPFFTRHKSTGTGLGLAIAQRIVTAHGGEIACVPHKTRGVALWFTLPAVSEQVTATPALPGSSAALTALVAASVYAARESSPPPSEVTLPEVAIVDDSRAFLVSWRTALQGSALTHVFSSPEEFWAKVDAAPDLVSRLAAVVTDYRFTNSRQTGVSFAKALKRKRADVPVFMSTSGYVSKREIEGAIDVALEKETMDWPALQEALRESVASLRKSEGGMA